MYASYFSVLPIQVASKKNSSSGGKTGLAIGSWTRSLPTRERGGGGTPQPQQTYFVSEAHCIELTWLMCTLYRHQP